MNKEKVESILILILMILLIASMSLYIGVLGYDLYKTNHESESSIGELTVNEGAAMGGFQAMVEIDNNTTIPDELLKNFIFMDFYKHLNTSPTYFTTTMGAICPGAAGCYIRPDGEIYIEYPVKSMHTIEWVSYHELAHRFFFEKLTEEERMEWVFEIWNDNCYVETTEYGYSSHVESFAEAMATYYHKGISMDNIKLNAKANNWINKKLQENNMPIVRSFMEEETNCTTQEE